MVDCLPSAIIHAYMGESVIPYIMRKSVARYQGLLPVEFHSNRYLYYASDFFSSINTYDIVSYFLNKHSEVYYRLITDFLISKTPKGRLFCDLFLSPYHMCLNEKADKLETSFYSVIVVIELTLSEVKMHVRQETYSYIVSTYNVEQASLLGLFQILRTNSCCALTDFNLHSNEHVKQFNDVSVYQYIALPKLKKFSHINEILRRNNCHQLLTIRGIAISHESRSIENSIGFSMLINQQVMLGISIFSNRILLRELQRRLIILSAWWRINNGVCISLSTVNISIFSTDKGKRIISLSLYLLLSNINYLVFLYVVLCSHLIMRQFSNI